MYAPNIDQHHTVDHTKREETPEEKRNILVESSRVARGYIQDLKEFNPDEFDGIVLPGGFGVAVNDLLKNKFFVQ